jgi:hypothetical protein
LRSGRGGGGRGGLSLSAKFAFVQEVATWADGRRRGQALTACVCGCGWLLVCVRALVCVCVTLIVCVCVRACVRACAIACVISCDCAWVCAFVRVRVCALCCAAHAPAAAARGVIGGTRGVLGGTRGVLGGTHQQLQLEAVREHREDLTPYTPFTWGYEVHGHTPKDTHLRARARAHKRVRTHTHTNKRTHTHKHAHTHARTRTHTRTHTHTHTRARAHTRTHTRTHTRARARAHTHPTFRHTLGRARHGGVRTQYTTAVVVPWISVYTPLDPAQAPAAPVLAVGLARFSTTACARTGAIKLPKRHATSLSTVACRWPGGSLVPTVDFQLGDFAPPLATTGAVRVSM